MAPKANPVPAGLAPKAELPKAVDDEAPKAEVEAPKAGCVCPNSPPVLLDAPKGDGEAGWPKVAEDPKGDD